MGHKVSWKIGLLICYLVTSRLLNFLQKDANLSPCNFAATHLTASLLSIYSGSEKGVFLRKFHFLEILESLETQENPQTLEHRGESNHFQFLEIPENFEIFRDSSS